MSKASEQRKVIQRAKRELKSEPAYLEICKEYNVKPDIIDGISISFKPLDVSAKTINGEVFLNERLFESGDMIEVKRYVTHETVHVLQQNAGLVDTKTDDNDATTTDGEDYLNDPNELEAFQTQLEFMDDHQSPEEIQKYIENLLDHHSIRGKERRKKVIELTQKI